MFSGGIGSWAEAKRVAADHGTDDLILLFCDTKTEDSDLYRFITEAAADVGGELVTVAEGRDIWQVFADVKFLGTSRVDPCSRVLKREVADRWLDRYCDPRDTVVYVGIDWTEAHRYEQLRDRKRPWRYEAPLLAPRYLTKRDMLDWLKDLGIAPPRLYGLGFAHNNCGGGCVKAGVGHFAHLYRALPEVFASWESHEQDLRDQLGDVAILRDRTGGVSRPLPLSALRARIDAGQQVDLFDLGGCGCFVDDEVTA